MCNDFSVDDKFQIGDRGYLASGSNMRPDVIRQARAQLRVVAKSDRRARSFSVDLEEEQGAGGNKTTPVGGIAQPLGKCRRCIVINVGPTVAKRSASGIVTRSGTGKSIPSVEDVIPIG